MHNKLIHRHHYSFFKSWHIFALLIPIVIFSFTVAYFNKDSQVKSSAASIAVSTPNPYISIKIGDVNITATVVDNEHSRRVGLSNHNSLRQNEGMLFVFDERNVEHISFWMKDMSFSIDIIWIDDGKVVQIDHDVQPQPGVEDENLKFYLSSQPIDYVLEVNSGFALKNNIFVGTELKLEGF